MKQIQEQHQAVTILQKHLKASKVRKRYLHFRATVVFVQRRYRALTAVRTRAAICIQSSYRGFKVRKDIQHMHLAAILIQSLYRMHRAKLDYQAKKTAIVLIQYYYRSYVRVKTERKKFLALQKSVRIIQAAYRGMKVRRNWKNIFEAEMAAIDRQSAFSCHRTETPYEAVQSSALNDSEVA